MKIAVIVRTYNEQKNLPKFIEAYIDWVDYILVQDDWSEDWEYLQDLPKKVLVSFYTGERIERDKITRAKQDIQLNSLIQWAEHIKADWIIHDDCDCVPNYHLIRGGRHILENCDKDFVYATRLYLYKDQGHFPELAKHEGEWVHSLWAWKANKGFEFLENGDNGQKAMPVKKKDKFEIGIPPYCLLHSPWPDDATIAEKRFRYSQIYGDQYENFDPLKFGGELEELPEWVNGNVNQN